MLANGDANNGFADLKAFATANGSAGTFTFGTGTNAGAAAGVAIPTGTNGTAGATDAGKLVLAQEGDYGTTGKNAIDVTYVAGGKTFTQKVELDWTAGVTQATDAAGPNTVAFSSVPAIVGSSSEEVIGGKSTLSVVEARQANIKAVGTNAVLSAELATFVGKAANAKGTYSLTGTDAASFSVNEKTGDIESVTKMDFETKASYDFNLVYTKGAKVYTENIALSVTNDEADDVAHVADIDMSTSEGAAAAVTVLDTALNTISSAQAKLGAIQNRLQHNIDNLSMASMLTETARGRIVDADFARETSELSKQQILSQAATSMLAQANQSKQSVLALLQ
jgi:flagellin